MLQRPLVKKTKQKKASPCYSICLFMAPNRVDSCHVEGRHQIEVRRCVGAPGVAL